MLSRSPEKIVSKQQDEFLRSFGEAMFYAHLIEDLLALHLFECCRFKANDVEGLSRRKIKKMDAEERIESLLLVYKAQNEKDGSILRLTSALHGLRKIRNHLTHGFITQVGSDLAAEEGIDQILAMLEQVVRWEKVWLGTLQSAHETLLASVISSPELILACDDPIFDARVSGSKIQALLGEHEGLFPE